MTLFCSVLYVTSYRQRASGASRLPDVTDLLRLRGYVVKSCDYLCVLSVFIVDISAHGVLFCLVAVLLPDFCAERRSFSRLLSDVDSVFILRGAERETLLGRR